MQSKKNKKICSLLYKLIKISHVVAQAHGMARGYEESDIPMLYTYVYAYIYALLLYIYICVFMPEFLVKVKLENMNNCPKKLPRFLGSSYQFIIPTHNQSASTPSANACTTIHQFN